LGQQVQIKATVLNAVLFFTILCLFFLNWSHFYREYIELITGSIKRIADFLNSFDMWEIPHLANDAQDRFGKSWSHLIFVIFSPPSQFFAKFVSTQKRVNRAKTDLTKTAENRFYNKKMDKFQISSHLSCGEMWNFSKFGKISHFATSVVWKNWNSSSCGEISDFFTSVMYWNLKFLHMTDFFLHLYIRYHDHDL